MFQQTIIVLTTLSLVIHGLIGCCWHHAHLESVELVSQAEAVEAAGESETCAGHSLHSGGFDCHEESHNRHDDVGHHDQQGHHNEHGCPGDRCMYLTAGLKSSTLSARALFDQLMLQVLNISSETTFLLPHADQRPARGHGMIPLPEQHLSSILLI